MLRLRIARSLRALAMAAGTAAIMAAAGTIMADGMVETAVGIGIVMMVPVALVTGTRDNA
jgi:hypothetical protein